MTKQNIFIPLKGGETKIVEAEIIDDLAAHEAVDIEGSTLYVITHIATGLKIPCYFGSRELACLCAFELMRRIDFHGFCKLNLDAPTGKEAVSIQTEIMAICDSFWGVPSRMIAGYVPTIADNRKELEAFMARKQ